MRASGALILLVLVVSAGALLAGCGGSDSIFSGGTQPRFEPLGFVGADNHSEAFAVSADGNVAAGMSQDSAGRVAFRWTESGGMVGLPLPGTLPDSEAHAASGDGSVIGGEGILFDVDFAFTWTQAGGSQLVPNAPLGVDPTIVAAVSADGTQLFGSAGVTPQQAVRWRASDGLVGLGFLYTGTGKGSAVNGVSGDGSVATGQSFIDATGDQRGLRWTQAGGMTPLPPLGADTLSAGWGISNDGTVIVGWSCTTSACRAARWDNAGALPTALGSLPGLPESFAFGASGDGTVIVGYATDGAGNNVAFIWDAAHGMQDLRAQLAGVGLATPLTGWTLTSANGISSDGRVIVGTGINPSGQTEAWRVVLR